MAGVSRKASVNLLRCVQNTAKLQSVCSTQKAHYGTSPPQKEFAYEMSCSNIRYGEGVTREVGMDCKNLGGRNVCVMTDGKLKDMQPVHTTLQSLDDNKVKYKLFDRCRVEPTNESFQDAINFAKSEDFDVFVAVGGGSVMDTCKAANLFATNPKAELLDYVNAPIGKGLPVTHQLKPLIAGIEKNDLYTAKTLIFGVTIFSLGHYHK